MYYIFKNITNNDNIKDRKRQGQKTLKKVIKDIKNKGQQKILKIGNIEKILKMIKKEKQR